MVSNDQLIQDASVADVLNQFDLKNGDTPLSVKSAIDEGKWVVLTSMQDGLPRPPIPRIHAERVLKKRRPDGSPAFWIEGMPYSPPKPQKGSIKCMLHPDFDETDGPAGFDRSFVDEAGLSGVTCNMNARDKKNRDDFANVVQRDDHMKSKHPRFYAAIQSLIERRAKTAADAAAEADREMVRAQQQAILALAGQRPQEAAQSDPSINLEYLNAEGLRAYADAHGIELTNRQSVTQMRAEIEAA